MDDEREPVVAAADDVYEGVRAISHLTITAVHPAPTVYSVLGNLKVAGFGLDQVCRQLATSLGRSLDAYAVYEWEGGDPVQSVTSAKDHLTAAARLAQQLGHELEAAQSAIARQGHNGRRE